jgi:transposase
MALLCSAIENSLCPAVDGQSEEERLRAENARLRAQVASLEARILELEGQLNRNSQNSHQPPSSDGLKKPKRARTKSLRGKSKNRSGGQPGHTGHTLEASATPDKVVDHYPGQCSVCGGPLTPEPESPYQARQVHDLPTPSEPDVTEHRAHEQICPACRAKTQASFPEGVSAPVQSGPNMSAHVVYLRNQHFLPEARLSQIMKDLFNAAISTRTISQMTTRAAQVLAPVAACIREQIVRAPVKHLDETGCRVRKTLRWVHIACTKELTHYRLGKRGDVPTDMTGIVVHDHWKSYLALPNVKHAFCNVHHLRECQALIENEKEEWARQMAILLRRACHVVKLSREHDKPLRPRFIERIERRYDQILQMGLEYHEALPPLERQRTKPPGLKANGQPKKPRGKIPLRIGHNLLLRFKQFKDATLRFLHDPTVPFDNNLGENAARMVKLKDKVSGCSRTEEGAEEFLTIRSVISTAQKQGEGVLKTLKEAAQNIINKITGKNHLNPAT